MDPRIVTRKLALLRGLAVREVQPLSGWSKRTAQHLGPGRYAYDGNWARTRVPDRVAGRLTAFYRTTLRVPAAVPAKDAFLFFDLDDLEGQLFVNDKAYAGVDHNHLRVPLPAGRVLRLRFEFRAVPAQFWRLEYVRRGGCFGAFPCIIEGGPAQVKRTE